jgi:2'-5' RNA ligase
LVRLPENAAWLRDFVDELISFPGCANDDQTDALVQALNYLRHPGEPSILTYYKALAYPDEYPEVFHRTPTASGLEYEKQRLQRAIAARRCHLCKQPLPPGSHIAQGEFVFHIRCYEAGKPMPLDSPHP